MFYELIFCFFYDIILLTKERKKGDKRVKAIFKYKVYQGAGRQFVIKAPVMAEPLSVVYQDDDIFVYALIDVDSDEELERFCVEKPIIILGTGWYISAEENKKLMSGCYKFLGTVWNDEKTFVWHVWGEK